VFSSSNTKKIVFDVGIKRSVVRKIIKVKMILDE